MKFSWIACQPNCKSGGSGWISAVGIVTADSPRDFDEFARGRQLGDASTVLDSSGGSANDSIALGRRRRDPGALTTVGVSLVSHTAQGDRASVAPEACCESMCVFLMPSGKTRYVPETAHVRKAKRHIHRDFRNAQKPSLRERPVVARGRPWPKH
jgi:hypothetical protein